MQTKPLSHIEICDALTAIRLKLQLLRAATHSLEETIGEQDNGITGGYDLIHYDVLDSLKLIQQSITSHKLAQ